MPTRTSKVLCQPRDWYQPELHEAGITGVADAVRASRVFDASALFTERAFFAGIDYLACLAAPAYCVADEATPPRVAIFASFLSFAHLALWAAAIFARAPARRVRFFALLAGATTVAFLAADAAVVRAAFCADRLDFAQRARWAAAIRSRASALNVRLFAGPPDKLAAAGRPSFRFPSLLSSAKSAFTS